MVERGLINKKILIRVAVDEKNLAQSTREKKKNQCALKSPLPRHFSKKSYSLKKPIVLLASSACFCLLPLRSLSPSFPLILFPSTIHTLVELVMIGSFEKPKILRYVQGEFRVLSPMRKRFQAATSKDIGSFPLLQPKVRNV